MLRGRTINPLASKKIIAENILEQICLRNNDFVLNEIQDMEDAQLILLPLVENGSIEYESRDVGDDWDETNKTVTHHLNILEFLIENKKYENILEAIFSNKNIKEDLEKQNLEALNEIILSKKYRSRFPVPNGHFMLKNMIDFVFADKDNFNEKKHIFKILNNYYSLDDLVSHIVGSEPTTSIDLQSIKDRLKEKVALFSYTEMNEELDTKVSDNTKKLKV